MKAKDTVMNYDKVQELGLESVDHNGYDPKLLEAQAEISFKAGIKEVVEWIKIQPATAELAAKGTLIGARFSAVYENEWQAKLKEWGIDNMEVKNG